MRFRTQLTNIITFTSIASCPRRKRYESLEAPAGYLADSVDCPELTASLSSLGKICWMRLESGIVRFTIIPDQGTQVWAQLPVDSIFDEPTYTLQSNSGVINLEVPIGALHRALRSAIGASSATLRLTKKGNVPLLALTVVASSWTAGRNALGVTTTTSDSANAETDADADHYLAQAGNADRGSGPRERETVITQEIPVKVLHESVVEGLHEPRCRDPDVHIILPSLIQLKSISDRFTKLAATDTSKVVSLGGAGGTTTSGPNSTGEGGSNSVFSSSSSGSAKLELSANMHGSLKLAIATDALRISSVWTGLVNPPLDPAQLSQTDIDQLPSERMRALGGDSEEGWAKVRIDGKDWGRVLSVGRLSPKVVACFIHETALILYVYLPGSWNEEESCLTYYVNSYAT